MAANLWSKHDQKFYPYLGFELAPSREETNERGLHTLRVIRKFLKIGVI